MELSKIKYFIRNDEYCNKSFKKLQEYKKELYRKSYVFADDKDVFEDRRKIDKIFANRVKDIFMRFLSKVENKE